ncbi:hypothetical protein [Paenibacillus sp. KN14-4R]|uniref:hypothetical protein n=1 Tax=Paenibacillus sp. KN14-4R TaxID=3445773 RepID=UPI003FA01892
MPTFFIWIKENWLSILLILGVIVAAIKIIVNKSEYQLEDETETVEPDKPAKID